MLSSATEFVVICHAALGSSCNMPGALAEITKHWAQPGWLTRAPTWDPSTWLWLLTAWGPLRSWAFQQKWQELQGLLLPSPQSPTAHCCSKQSQTCLDSKGGTETPPQARRRVRKFAAVLLSHTRLVWRGQPGKAPLSRYHLNVRGPR